MPQTPISVVKAHGTLSDPVAQMVAVQQGKGTWSHDEDLPLRLSIKRAGWLGRKIRATTTEPVWYRDAITYIEVPAGFTYDLASIPRVLWVFVSPWDIALEALFHDLLYRQQSVKRRVADTTLQSMMQDRGVPPHIVWAVFLGVRMFGGRAWRARAAENAAAEKLAQRKGEVIDTESRVMQDEVPPVVKSETN